MVDKTNNIFIINGQKTSGKDYLSREVSNFLGMEAPINISTVDVIKKMYELIGYKENVKEVKDKFRVVLSDAKDSIDKNLNNWTTFNCLDRALEANQKLLGVNVPIFIHNREPEKIAFMVSEFYKRGYSVRTLKVEADWLDNNDIKSATCHADKNINNFDYDLVFSNTKDPVDFHDRLLEFVTDNILQK